MKRLQPQWTVGEARVKKLLQDEGLMNKFPPLCAWRLTSECWRPGRGREEAAHVVGGLAACG